MRTIARIAVGCAACLALASGAGAETAWLFEEGVASWYGGKFHGRQTASGEVFDKRAMTAAHRTLPFGTVLLVTNRDNGRTARVRVNDRGPFIHGRILDCSEAAAEALGYRGAGLARVRLEIAGDLPAAEGGRLGRRDRKKLERSLARAARHGRRLPRAEAAREAGPAIERAPSSVRSARAASPSAASFVVQVGAFADAANARRLASRLKAAGWSARTVAVPQRALSRVQVGPFAERETADAAAALLRGAGLPAFARPSDG